MRQAKIGPGTGSETVDADKAKAYERFTHRAVVARAALAHLRAQAPGVPVFVAGHSEGALVASLLAAEPGVQLDGVVSLSGPAPRLLDVMRGQTNTMAGGAANMTAFDQAVENIRNGQSLPDGAQDNPKLVGLASMTETGRFSRRLDWQMKRGGVWEREGIRARPPVRFGAAVDRS